MSNSCPAQKALLRYLRGETSDDQTESIENHLVKCSQCQDQLEILSEEPDSLMRMVADAVVPQLVASAKTGGAQSSARVPYPPVHNAASNARNSNSMSPSQLAFVRAEPVNMIRDYRLMECIGQGGMGSVYRAWHVGMNRHVALKILKSDRMASTEAVSRFKREIMLVAKLEHPQIVRALDAGEHDGLPYFVMEFVSGIDLSQLVRRVGPLPTPEACQIVRLAASALQYAHEQKVIHRDVKPSNLMITAESNIKLLDLGLAQILDLKVEESLTQTNQALGTLAYMAPEQLSGRHPITQQSDIFSLGVTLHELLTGQRPFERPGLLPLVSDLKSIRPDVDDELNVLVASMLSLNPSERPASMSEVVSRLSSVASSAELSVLLAEYYRWNHRSFPPPISAFAQAETEPSAAASTDSQSVPPQSTHNKTLVLTPANGKTTERHANRWQAGLAGLAIAGCIAALYGITSWIGEKPVITVVPTGSIEIKAEGELPSQLVEEGFVQVENIDTGKKYNLDLGKNELQPGKYEVNYHSAPEAFRDGGSDYFEVFADSPSKLLIQPILAHRFQFPVIPTKAGAAAIYRGTFWRAPWAKNAVIPYTLNLEVLSVIEELNQPVSLWLKIEILHQNCGYTETAYLQIDAKRWETHQEFEIIEGWVEAKSSLNAKYMLLGKQSGIKDSLVVPFELELDTLFENALLLLPEHRLSAHDVVALFFGEKSSDATACIKRLRADLSESNGRNEWLGNGSFGACYIASSRKRDEATSMPGYSLHRRKSDEYNPYGFLELEVKIPETLTAECILINSSASPSPPSAVNNLLEKLRSNKFHAAALFVSPEVGRRTQSVPFPLPPENGMYSPPPGNAGSVSLPFITDL
ncbi:MAG: serine/threonine-protein kinase, partial [Aureliella sp.]